MGLMKVLNKKYGLILPRTSTSLRAQTPMGNSKMVVDQLQVLLPSNSCPPRNQMVCNMNIDGDKMLIEESSEDRGSKVVGILIWYCIGLLTLLETRTSGVKIDKVIKNLRMNSWYKVDAQGFFGGIWIAWDSFLIKVDIIGLHP
ncbi:hypothetical protein CR513_22960, partial [Mucuna pruriens]